MVIPASDWIECTSRRLGSHRLHWAFNARHVEPVDQIAAGDEAVEKFMS